MAKENKKNGEKKKSGKGCIYGILAIVLIILLLASFVFAIFDAIVGFIKSVVLGIIKDTINFLAHPVESTIQAIGNLDNWLKAMQNQDYSGWAGEITQPNQLIEISQDDFIAMRDAIDESISRDAVGLDDVMLKKMLLAYNTGKYSRNADIIIELTNEEAEELKKEDTLPSSFKIKTGAEIEQLEYTSLESLADTIQGWIDGEDVTNEIKAKQCKKKKTYLCTKGVLVFYNENYDPDKTDEENKKYELVYFDKTALKELYNEFESNRYGAHSDYAQSLWEYLSTKCYTDSDNGIAMYGYEKVEEELVDWYFEANNPDKDTFKKWVTDFSDAMMSGVVINRKTISDEYLSFSEGWLSGGLLDIAKKEYELQDLEYYSLVSQYTTPVEFMIDLLNISSSKEFVNAFIDKMASQTEVALRIYRVSNSSSEEIREITNEKTTVAAKANIKVEITKYDYAYDTGDTLYDTTHKYFKDYEPVTVEEVIINDGKTFFNTVDSIDVTIKLGNLNEAVIGVAGKIIFNWEDEGSEKGAEYYFEYPNDFITDWEQFWSGENQMYKKYIENGGFYEFTIEDVGWGTTAYKERTNIATIKKYTTKITTETKLDIAVERAETWYGIFEYNNKMQKDVIFETIENEGDTVRVTANRIDTVDKKGNITNTTWEPVMISKDLEDETYTRDSSNKDTIFAEHSIGDYAWEEIGSRIERWYADLKADDIVYWLTAGPLTHTLYEQLDEDKGYQLLEDPDELLNIRLTYAMENGPRDWWLKKHYLPYEMTVSAEPVTDEKNEYYDCLKDTGYAIGYLYETVNRHLIPGTVTVKENTGFFLSLLKNSTGKYSKDATYDANGEEVVYKTIYDSEDRVARFFETSADMFFELLESSPNTQGLADIMRYTLYKYSNQDYGVTEFNYEIINIEGFEDI